MPLISSNTPSANKFQALGVFLDFMLMRQNKAAAGVAPAPSAAAAVEEEALVEAGGGSNIVPTLHARGTEGEVQPSGKSIPTGGVKRRRQEPEGNADDDDRQIREHLGKGAGGAAAAAPLPRQPSPPRASVVIAARELSTVSAKEARDPWGGGGEDGIFTFVFSRPYAKLYAVF